MALRIGVTPPGLDRESLRFVIEAERIGADSVWVPEAWMYDALTPLGYLAAVTERMTLAAGVVQLGSRSPALLAMSALALQELSGGRFVLGVGTSGPQVMEGWHGVPFDRPVTRTSETIDIVRSIAAGERLRYEGRVYTLPLPHDEGDGGGPGDERRGRPALRSPVAGTRIPIYVASIGPVNLRMTGAKADGWIGTAFLPESADVFLGPLAEGAAEAGRSLDDVELTVAVGLEFVDDGDAEAAARRHAAGYAFTIGAMGSASTNFYNQAFARQGFGEAVGEVQRLWRDGHRQAAADRVPIEIGLGTNLIGDDAAVAARLRLYRDCGISTLRVSVPGSDTTARLDGLARLMDLVASVNAE